MKLGEVTVPSGVLHIFDPGVISFVLSGELDELPTIVIDGLPRDRPLAVEGMPGPDGRWDHVAVQVSNATVAKSDEVGVAIVDFARLLVADKAVHDHWVHEESMDGRADFVFWGRDAQALADAIKAPALGEGTFGWKDLAVDQAVALGTRAKDLKAANAWKLATDFRPHSHHFHALEGVRASKTESATLAVGPLTVCLFMTSVGDGEFPICVDRASNGAIVRVRVQF